MAPEKPSSPTALLFLKLLPPAQGLEVGEDEGVMEMCPWSGGDAELSRTTIQGPPPFSSAAEMKPT